MKSFFVTFLAFCILCLTSCSNYTSDQTIHNEIKSPTCVGDISYDNDKSFGYHVYIEENGDFVPFLVLSSDYNGYCLLLREYLLDSLMEYNYPGEYGSYYKDSRIDKYLNNVYYLNFSEKVRKLILNSDIKITTKNAIDTHDKETEIISRKVFLLSASEINDKMHYTYLDEGDKIAYFKDIKNRVALHENGECDSWMLRTPALQGVNDLMAIGPDGSIGMGGINGMEGVNKISVRPAFCIPSETKIIQKNIEGQNVFCIQ